MLDQRLQAYHDFLLFFFLDILEDNVDDTHRKPPLVGCW